MYYVPSQIMGDVPGISSTTEQLTVHYMIQ